MRIVCLANFVAAPGWHPHGHARVVRRLRALLGPLLPSRLGISDRHLSLAALEALAWGFLAVHGAADERAAVA